MNMKAKIYHRIHSITFRLAILRDFMGINMVYGKQENILLVFENNWKYIRNNIWNIYGAFRNHILECSIFVCSNQGIVDMEKRR